MNKHPTNDPTNPLHRLADDMRYLAAGAAPKKASDFRGIAADIDAVLTSHAVLFDALKAAQSALAMMTQPNAIEHTTVLHAYTQAVEAEAKARTALGFYP